MSGQSEGSDDRTFRLAEGGAMIAHLAACAIMVKEVVVPK